jgi:3-hydroxyisobutyrate dehydrogenase-like beta-hydroxyacid dehydrogenase
MENKQRLQPRLGFIGMGGMGSRMAARLFDAGYDLTVYSREHAHARPLEERGAKVATTPSRLIEDADVVFSSVADDAAVVDVMYGNDGALTAARSGTTFIEMSTISPELARRLYQDARSKGVVVLDAPVSGSTPQAEQGQLVIFVGGDMSVYDRCEPLLRVLAKESLYMGNAGSGAMMKLCVNTLLGLGMQALAEAVALGLKGGLERARLVKALGDTSVLSPSQKSKLENVNVGTFPATFPLRLMFKDFGLIMESAMKLSVAMPATAAAAQVYAVENTRQASSGRDEDFSAVIRTMEQLAGICPEIDPRK